MSAISVRPARREDIPVLHAMVLELAEFERLRHEVRSTEESLARALFGDPPAAEALLAECEGTVAGFALFFETYSTFLGTRKSHLEDLYVREDRRGRGVGKALLSALCELAVERGHGRIEWTVLNWNTDAISFYEKIGGRVRSDWRIVQLPAEEARRMVDREPLHGSTDG